MTNNILWDDNEEVIDRFDGTEFHFLSNFSLDQVWVLKHNGLFQTSEHAFQTAKTNDKEWKEKIREASNPGKAKSLGNQCPLRKDWDDVKDSVMYDILQCKFSKYNAEILKKLIETYPRKLIEGNTWGDRYWGCTEDGNGNLVGRNTLGQQLMLIRYQRMMGY